MIKRILAALTALVYFLALGIGAAGADTILPSGHVDGSGYVRFPSGPVFGKCPSASQCGPSDFEPLISGQFRAQPHAINNAAFASLPATSLSVIRDGYAFPGDGGHAVYSHASAPCATSGGDGGLQIAAADGGCWLIDPSLPITPMLFGADPKGLVDSNSAFQNTINAVGAAGGGEITYCGQFRINAISDPSYSYVHLRGCAYGRAVLLQTSATAVTVSFGSSTCCAVQNVGIEKTQITPAPGVVRTTGASVRCQFTFKCDVLSNDVESPFAGIEIFGANLSHIRDNYVHQVAACSINVPNPVLFVSGNYSVGIWDHGNATSNSVANDIRHNFVSSAYNYCFGIYLGGGVQGETVSHNSVQEAYKNGFISNIPGNGDAPQPVLQNFFDHNQWDVTASLAGTSPGRVCPTLEYDNATFTIRANAAGADISNNNFDNEWTASSLCGPGTAVISDGSNISQQFFNHPRALNNWGPGIYLFPLGSTMSEINIEQPLATGNSGAGIGTYAGIDVESGVQGLTVNGGAARDGNQSFGIVLQASTTTSASIHGVDLNGNHTGCLLNNATGPYNSIGSDNSCGAGGLSVPWTTYVTGASCTSGTPTAVTATGRYRRQGSVVYVQINVVFGASGVGTCTGGISVGLPFPTTTSMALYGSEFASSGFGAQSRSGPANTTTLIYKYDGQTLAGNGYSIFVNGSYETPQ